MKLHPNSLANLTREHQQIITTSERASELGKRSAAKRAAMRALMDQFKINAKAYASMKEKLPELTGVDVLRIAMHTALQKENFEDAARYANMLAEYEQPKLQRVDKTVTARVVDISDEDLQKMIDEEGLSSGS